MKKRSVTLFNVIREVVYGLEREVSKIARKVVKEAVSKSLKLTT